MVVLMIMERQLILKETHLEVMCRFQHEVLYSYIFIIYCYLLLHYLQDH